MVEEFKCPLCDSKGKCKIVYDDDYTLFHCATFGGENGVDYNIHEDIIEMNDGELKDKILDLILEWLLERPLCNTSRHKLRWYFYYVPIQTSSDYIPCEPNFVNIAHYISGYPKTLQEKADRALINLYKQYPNYGDNIFIFWDERRLIFEHTENNHGTVGILHLMSEMGLLTEDLHESFSISAQGWQRIYELEARKVEKKQGFVAMAFKEETKPIREASRKGIVSAGYSASIIDEKEHNNQIVPEIFYEIEHSRFLVVDITYPNNGAYYEAGYALGKGKEVIFCCKKEAFDCSDTRPHFDVAQKSMIIWETEDELTERLAKRIEITVGQS